MKEVMYNYPCGTYTVAAADGLAVVLLACQVRVADGECACVLSKNKSHKIRTYKTRDHPLDRSEVSVSSPFRSFLNPIKVQQSTFVWGILRFFVDRGTRRFASGQA